MDANVRFLPGYRNDETIPFAGGASAFLGAGTGTFFSGTGFLGTSGTLKK